MQLDTFNDAERRLALAHIRPCLAIARWLDAVVDARPYDDLATLREQARCAAEPFTEAEIDAALAQHPRIGERAAGAATEAAMSTREQAGLGAADAEMATALRQGNLAYERRFGRVFLIRAAGRDRAEVLSELRRRLQHDERRELQIIASELRDIALGRLHGLIRDRAE